jgi:hypothetical protein
MEHEPAAIRWSDPDVGVLLDGLKYGREDDPKYPIQTRALGLAMAVRRKTRHSAMGSREYMTENIARDRLVLIGGYAAIFDVAMKYLDSVDSIMAASINVEDAARRVQAAAPRLANVTNLTVISFSFLEGVRMALDQAVLSVGSDLHEIADDYYLECASMTVVRLALLLDRDDPAVSFQGVYRSLHHPEVVEALVRQTCDDPLQPALIEENIRHSVDEFLRIYRTIDWELYGRLSHFRNLGVAHLSHDVRRRITHDELRSLVQLVKDLSGCLAPLTVSVPPVRDDEISSRTERAAKMWLSALQPSNR